jgi:hypothetical protein
MRDLHAVADYSDVFIFSLLIWIPRLSIADWSCYLVVNPENQSEVSTQALDHR